MIFVVRMDLKLSLNKIAELTATGALQTYKKIEIDAKNDPFKEEALYTWTEVSSKKIVVKAPTEKDLLELL